MNILVQFSYLLIFLYSTYRLFFLEKETHDFVYSILLQFDIASSIMTIQRYVLKRKGEFDRVYFLKLGLCKFLFAYLVKFLLMKEANFVVFVQK